MKRMAFFLVAASLFAAAQGADVEWTSFAYPNAAQPSFRFDFPKTWKITTETSPVMHYRQVYVALNNFGREKFQVIDFNTGPGIYKYGSDSTFKQLPAGAVYLDIATWEGPPLPKDFKIEDTPDTEIVAQLGKETQSNGDDKELRSSDIEFNKGGRRWSIFIDERAPFNEGDSSLLRRVLDSMNFESAKK